SCRHTSSRCCLRSSSECPRTRIDGAGAHAQRSNVRRNPVIQLALAFLGAGLGAGLAIIGAGYGIGRLAASAMEGIARQPAAAGEIRTSMIIAAALIEG